MADTNPGNFANRPTEEVREIAAKGGHASHSGQGGGQASHQPGRNPDGTFAKGSEAAKEAGHKGGLASGGATDDSHHAGRNLDGTFTKGSEAAKEAGHKGGIH
ncbi:hypothetical protein B0J12DRAFT_574204 [Macrophomina phaseolina]|uniref:Conidiation-specific protein 10 n=1 Tax=Macrophomina phaseolina TaxID=35725 RepID=A0ABQ8GA42_9PEZI|nr:hypothetical protein B0J12DRAFT_574204 [Macrophomina phaseolina]